MAGLQDQKQNTRIRVLEHWRLVRLSEKFKLLKRHNQAHLTLLKIFQKANHCFFDIRDVSRKVDLEYSGGKTIRIFKKFTQKITEEEFFQGKSNSVPTT
jgi:hypothetical protein